MRWLLDIVAIIALVLWQRATQRPALRLVMGSAAPGKARRVPRVRPGLAVVAVLVSDPGMEERLRRALSHRCTLIFTKTWAELQDTITRLPPVAVFADPLADGTGNPDGHLARLCEWGVEVILYTTLTPLVAGKLLALGQKGIHHVLFHPFDDGAGRLNDVFDYCNVMADSRRAPPPHEPPKAA